MFLHEGLGSMRLWRDVPDTLCATTGCAGLVYSRYGNGFSPELREPRTPHYMHDEAHALAQLLEHNGLNDVILIGHSDGASIALIYAGEIATHLRACVLLAPHVFVEEHSVRGITRAREQYETGGLRERLARHHTDGGATFYGWNRIWLSPEFFNWNIRSSVRNISVPLLVIQGADDDYGTFAQIEAIREDAQGRVDVLYLDACGHEPQRDRAAVVVPAIAAFIDETLGSNESPQVRS